MTTWSRAPWTCNVRNKPLLCKASEAQVLICSQNTHNLVYPDYLRDWCQNGRYNRNRKQAVWAQQRAAGDREAWQMPERWHPVLGGGKMFCKSAVPLEVADRQDGLAVLGKEVGNPYSTRLRNLHWLQGGRGWRATQEPPVGASPHSTSQSRRPLDCSAMA